MAPSNNDDIPFVAWSELRMPFVRTWEQGEHVAIIGPTGQGKSTLAVALLQDRAELRKGNVVIFETKPKDSTIAKLGQDGWARIKQWPPEYKDRVKRRIIVWPPYGKSSQAAKRNRKQFVKALDGITNESGWCVYFDEAIYFTETLRMRHNLDELWNTARSNKVTVIASSQGVSWVPKAMTTQQSWIFCFRPRTQQTAKDTADLMGDRDRFYPVIRNLKAHEFVICRANTHEAYVSKLSRKDLR